MVNLSDPFTFIMVLFFTVVAVMGFYFFMREIVAGGIELHEQRKAEREAAERRRR